MKQRLHPDRSSADLRARVLHELYLVIKGDVCADNPVVRQLQQCPEAYEVGKIVEELCREIGREPHGGGRLMPPPGITLPPFA